MTPPLPRRRQKFWCLVVEHLVLASGSPRRLTLLRSLGFDPEVRVPPVDETPLPGETPAALVERLALAKLRSVVVQGEVGVAADTVVVVDDQILGKPDSTDEAMVMLDKLSGRTHEVVGGLAVRRGDHDVSGVVRTQVTFRSLSEQEIADYVATGEPMDKAGAYAIQGLGGAMVAELTGCRDNVVGLSLGAFSGLYQALGGQLPAAPGGTSR